MSGVAGLLDVISWLYGRAGSSRESIVGCVQLQPGPSGVAPTSGVSSLPDDAPARMYAPDPIAGTLAAFEKGSSPRSVIANTALWPGDAPRERGGRDLLLATLVVRRSPSAYVSPHFVWALFVAFILAVLALDLFSFIARRILSLYGRLRAGPQSGSASGFPLVCCSGS